MRADRCFGQQSARAPSSGSGLILLVPSERQRGLSSDARSAARAGAMRAPRFGDLWDSRLAGVVTCFHLPSVLTTRRIVASLAPRQASGRHVGVDALLRSSADREVGW